MAAFYWLHPQSCLAIKAPLLIVKSTFLWWCAVLSKFCSEVKKIPTLLLCVEDDSFINKLGGHLHRGWQLSLWVATSPKLWAVFCPFHIYCDQVDLPILLSVSGAVVLVISEASKGHANESRFPCQPQCCATPHYAKRCVAFFIHSCVP